MIRVGLFAVIHVILATAALAADLKEDLKVSLSWGHQSQRSMPHYIRLLAEGAEIQDIKAHDLESNDTITDNVLTTHAGGGDIDGVEFNLRYAPGQIKTIGNLHGLWSELIASSDIETVQRLKQDPAYRPDSRKLTVQMDEGGTKGFSVTGDQLLQSKVFRAPSLDVYLTAGDVPIPLEDHLRAIEAYKGCCILEQVRREPEATYEQYAARWEDMGSPAYQNRHMIPPGHIVGEIGRAHV